MSRNKITHEEIAAEFKRAYDAGFDAGMSARLGTEPWATYCWSLHPLSRWLETVYRDGVRRGQKRRREDIATYLAEQADTDPLPSVLKGTP